ncbi:MAG: HlyC/CorC family transporter [Alphaproteobacteria bacterium]|nr:HlyC/CorC family transporter [Alphaproteobacteria bacterium]
MPPVDSDTKNGRSPPAAISTEIQTSEDRSPATPQPRRLLSEIAARLAQAVRGLRQDSTMRESLEEVIEESERETKELSSQERLMLGNLLKFGELSVADVMVPRADIVAAEEQTSFADLVALFREAQHSRLPIYRETLDDPVGMVHIKDVVTLVEIGQGGKLTWTEAPIAKLKREVLFVPGAMPALDLLMKMQATRIHLALVVDEYGGTDGLVSIEDLVEVIVGDIDDEHDVDEDLEIRNRGDGGIDADARVRLEEFKERTGIDLAKAEPDDEADTLGGVVVAALGRVPVRGEVVSQQGFEFEILEADARRVKRLRIRPNGQTALAQAAS